MPDQLRQKSMQRPFRSQSPYRVGSAFLSDPGDAPRLASASVESVKVRGAGAPSCEVDLGKESVGDVRVWDLRIT